MGYDPDEIHADLEAAAAYEEIADDPITRNCPEYLQYCKDNAARLRSFHE